MFHKKRPMMHKWKIQQKEYNTQIQFSNMTKTEVSWKWNICTTIKQWKITDVMTVTCNENSGSFSGAHGMTSWWALGFPRHSHSRSILQYNSNHRRSRWCKNAKCK